MRKMREYSKILHVCRYYIINILKYFYRYNYSLLALEILGLNGVRIRFIDLRRLFFIDKTNPIRNIK